MSSFLHLLKKLLSSAPLIKKNDPSTVMDRQSFLPSYQQQSINELIALEGAYRTDSLVLAIESAILAKKESGRSISEVENLILAIEAMERNVNNGGFSAFFLNTGEYSPLIVNSLITINCPKNAALAEQAIACLNINTLEATPDTVRNKIKFSDDKLENELTKIDQIYYFSDEAIELRLFEYIKENSIKINIP